MADNNGQVAPYQGGGELAAGQEGQVEEYYGNQQVGNFQGEGKGKGEAFMQNEKLWLFGEKKPLSIQSYGSLPVEVSRPSRRAVPALPGHWARPPALFPSPLPARP